jgi:hypothetical protein
LPLGGERGGSCVRHALHARLPLGLHLALDLSPIDLRRRALFDPLHAELEEAPLPGLAVRRIGHFRPFPNDLRARSRIFQTPKDFTFFSFWINYGSKIFWSPTVLLLARLPLGLTSRSTSARSLFGHPLHAKVEEAPLPRRPVGLGHFRPFPNGFTGPSSSFCGSEYPLLLDP